MPLQLSVKMKGWFASADANQPAANTTLTVRADALATELTARDADGEEKLVVLDASPNRYLTTHPSTWGSTYLDIGSLVACLRGLVGIRQFTRLRRKRIASLERAFVVGYQAVHGDLLDSRMTDAVAYAIAGTYLRFRYRVPIIGAIGLRIMFPRP